VIDCPANQRETERDKYIHREKDRERERGRELIDPTDRKWDPLAKPHRSQSRTKSTKTCHVEIFKAA